MKCRHWPTTRDGEFADFETVELGNLNLTVVNGKQQQGG
jgi:hypothetical protein